MLTWEEWDELVNPDRSHIDYLNSIWFDLCLEDEKDPVDTDHVRV